MSTKRKKALGSGQYSKRVHYMAVKTGRAIKTSRGTYRKSRKMHRDDLLKWVKNPKRIDKKKGIIIDPRSIIPYRRDKTYGTIVAALMTKLPSSVATMEGILSKNFGQIKKWSGKHDPTIDGVIATDWIWASDLFKIACKINPTLNRQLKKRQSCRPGVKNRVRDPLQKFQNNIETIQRFSSPTKGGVTPYARPLMDVKMAIDSQWRYNKNGIAERQYRLVIDRSKPMKGYKSELKRIELKTAA